MQVMITNKEKETSINRRGIDVISIDDDIEATYVNHNNHTNRPRSKSVATTKLKESGLEEIIPIQHTQSCDHKIQGTYSVEDPGNYVLVFGN